MTSGTALSVSYQDAQRYTEHLYLLWQWQHGAACNRKSAKLFYQGELFFQRWSSSPRRVILMISPIEKEGESFLLSAYKGSGWIYKQVWTTCSKSGYVEILQLTSRKWSIAFLISFSLVNSLTIQEHYKVLLKLENWFCFLDLTCFGFKI